jgi:anti-sigma factor RsiW
MDCKKYAEDFSAYLDGEVAPARANEIRTHVENCPECAEEYYTLEESVHFLESHLRKIEPRQGSWSSLKARLNAVDAPPSRHNLLRFFFGLRPLFATAVLVIGLLAISLWGYRQLKQNQRDTEQYMNAYIEAREQEESAHRRLNRIKTAAIPKAPPPAITNPEYDENPFVTYESSSLENPFRSESQ